MKHLGHYSAARITLLYIFFACLWIFFSDRLMGGLTHSRRSLVWLETYNGWLFVMFTAPLLYFERRRADHGLRRLAAIVESSDDAIIGATIEGVITSWNRSAERVYGCSSRQAVGQSLTQVFSREEADLVPEILLRIAAGETVRHQEVLHVRHEGESVWLSLTFSPIQDGDSVTGVSVIARDISRRKRAQVGLMLRAQIIDQINDAVISVDWESTITSWNKGAEKLFGYSATETIGTSFALICPGSQKELLQDGAIEQLKHTGRHETEAKLRRKSGEDFYAHVSFSLLRDESGMPAGMIVYAIDMTEHRRAEKTRQMAEVGELASGLVHEVRNPLNAMRMQIAVLRRKLQRPDDANLALAAAQLDRLEFEVQRVRKLATDFLAYGKPGLDSPELVKVSEAIHEAAEFVRPDFEQRGIKITSMVDPAAERLLVRMDSGKLRQVLLNLAENAGQAMCAGGQFRITCQQASPQEVCITVSDTGTGIPAEELRLIFDAFYSTKDEGTGLGLAIVKQCIEAVGGSIEVESELGRGTLFEIVLPLADCSGQARPGESLVQQQVSA